MRGDRRGGPRGGGLGGSMLPQMRLGLKIDAFNSLCTPAGGARSHGLCSRGRHQSTDFSSREPHEEIR